MIRIWKMFKNDLYLKDNSYLFYSKMIRIWTPPQKKTKKKNKLLSNNYTKNVNMKYYEHDPLTSRHKITLDVLTCRHVRKIQFPFWSSEIWIYMNPKLFSNFFSISLKYEKRLKKQLF